MSQENVEIVRRIYEAVARGDSDAVLDLYDPEVEWDMTRGAWRELEERIIYRGHEGLRSWFREQWEIWDQWDDHPDELLAAGGDRVVSVVTSRSRGRASGVEVESHHAAIWTLRGGKVTRVMWFRSRDEALEAVGLRE